MTLAHNAASPYQNLVTKCIVIQKTSSGQTFTDILNLRCDLVKKPMIKYFAKSVISLEYVQKLKKKKIVLYSWPAWWDLIVNSTVSATKKREACFSETYILSMCHSQSEIDIKILGELIFLTDRAETVRDLTIFAAMYCVQWGTKEGRGL